MPPPRQRVRRSRARRWATSTRAGCQRNRGSQGWTWDAPGMGRILKETGGCRSTRHHESGLFSHIDLGFAALAQLLDQDGHAVRTGAHATRHVGRHANGDRHPTGLGRPQHQVLAALDHGLSQLLDAHTVALGVFAGVHDLDAVDVLDKAFIDHSRQGATVAHDVNAERRTAVEAVNESDDHGREDGRVDQHARAGHAGPHLLAPPAVFHAVERGVMDQAARRPDLVHDRVADVDARGAADALVLQALPDVDARRADLHAQGAVDAVALVQGLGIGTALARATGLTALGVVADDEGVAVEHRALKARVRAHVLAHLLAHVARVAIGGETVEQHPEDLPGAHAEVDDLGGKHADRREVADEGVARPQRKGDPGELLARLAPDLVHGPGGLVELHAALPIALDLALHPHEDLGVDRLRTGIATPQATGHR